MIITKTPFRMSFFGGGTDMPAFFNEHGGAVISTSFDKYCYVNARHLPQFFEYSSEVVYSTIERVTSVDEIEHPAVRNAMSMLDMHEMRVTYEGDLPSRTGLGTSSSFAVGLLNAFHSLKGSFASKRQLAEEAIYLERVLCGEAGGWQDQIAASFGGLNKITFADGDFSVEPIIINPERKQVLDSRLMLFFTGFTRMSFEIYQGRDTRDKTAELLEILALTDEAEQVLVDKECDLRAFGELLHETWMLKRGLGAKVSTNAIDAVYERARAAGAVGGKLLGAGGGGFLLFYVEEDRQQSVSEALGELMHIPFSFEEGGTRVVYYAPESYEPRK